MHSLYNLIPTSETDIGCSIFFMCWGAQWSRGSEDRAKLIVVRRGMRTNLKMDVMPNPTVKILTEDRTLISRARDRFQGFSKQPSFVTGARPGHQVNKCLW